MTNNADRLNDAHKDCVASLVQKAKDLALLDRPMTDAEVHLYMNQVRATYLDLDAQIVTWYFPDSNRAGGRSAILVAQLESEKLDEEIKQMEYAIRLHMLDHPNSKAVVLVPLKAIGITAITTLAVYGQVTWESLAFVSSGSSTSDSKIIATGIVMTFALVAHVTVWFVRQMKSWRWQVGTCLAVTAGVFVAYLEIGKLRASSIAAISEYTGGLNLSVVGFALLSTLMFLGVACLSVLLMPASDDLQEFLNHMRSRRALRKKQRELAAKKRERNAIPARHAAEQEERLRKVEAAGAARLRIPQLYHEAWAAFVETNLVRRRTPPPQTMFEEPPYP